MKKVNQKIIDAVIEKANKVCPESLALIGIYGSAATGDEYEKSDLDLLILIENDEGWKLGTGFILDDRKVGYDIYCTNWDGLRYDAECHYAHMSKLMDSQIVYVKNPEAYDELLKLRTQVKQFLISEERFQRVNELMKEAKVAYADACLSESLGQARLGAYGVIFYILNAIMLYHGTYFKRGVKRTFEELEILQLDEKFIHNIKEVAVSKDISELQNLLRCLILYAESHMRQEKSKLEPSEGLAGTYEEMYSNWRNKVEEAAENEDAFSSYMNMCSLHFMLKGISEEVEIGTFNILDEYSTDSLKDNIRTFDKYLQKYEDVYTRVGISIKRFANVDEFVACYLSE